MLSSHRRSHSLVAGLAPKLITVLAFATAAFIIPTPPCALGAQAVLTWDPPTTNADGTPLTDLAGYEIHYGTTPRTGSTFAYQNVQAIGDVTTSTLLLTDPASAPVTYYFAVKAVDTSGNKSDYSNEVFKTIQPAAQHTLTIAKSGTGTGVVTAQGINCGADCTEPFTQSAVVTLTATATKGSTFTGWSGSACSGTGECVLTMNSNTTVTASFARAQSTFTVTASADSGGSLSPSGNLTVTHGATRVFTITPATGYHIASVRGCGGTLSRTTYTTGPITANCAVTASFATNAFTVTASAGTGGSISPSGSVTVNKGARRVFTIAPMTGYHVASVTGCGGTLSGATYTTGPITATCAVTASFAANTFSFAASSLTGGPLSPSGNVTVNNGATVDYLSVGEMNTYTFHNEGGVQ